MQKLIDKYNAECAIKSTCANIIWKMGIILNSIIYCINVIGLKRNNYILLYFIIIIILFFVSQIVFVVDIGKRIGVKKSSKFLISLKYIRSVYKKIEEFQNQWIIKYCKYNKINTINKIQIIFQEIKSKREKSEIKYLNPIIIGTLFLTIWEITIEKLTVNIGFWNMLPIAVISIIGLSVGIGWISKEIIEDKKIFNQFQEYCGNQRLEELLIEVALKCKK